MADFDKEKAREEQKIILEKVDRTYKLLQSEVVNYYWERDPYDEDVYYDHLRAIYRYVKEADSDLERILDDLDRKLGY